MRGRSRRSSRSRTRSTVIPPQLLLVWSPTALVAPVLATPAYTPGLQPTSTGYSRILLSVTSSSSLTLTLIPTTVLLLLLLLLFLPCLLFLLLLLPLPLPLLPSRTGGVTPPAPSLPPPPPPWPLPTLARARGATSGVLTWALSVLPACHVSHYPTLPTLQPTLHDPSERDPHHL